MKDFGKKLLKVVAIAVVFGLVSGAVFSATMHFTGKAFGDESTKEVSKESGNKQTGGSVSKTITSTATTVTDVSDIVENVMPATVAVTAVSITTYRSWFGGLQQYESESAGSGVIIDQDSDYIYVVTNNHVVENAENVTIAFCDDEAVEGVVKGTDKAKDIAVVQVAVSDIKKDTMSKIKVATVGDSTKLVPGESSIVIGNALGYGQSVTTGVISALDREVATSDDYGRKSSNKLIQTDAAVNPGNSGGALLNMSGEVVGIVSAKYASTEVEGFGFAIPISDAMTIVSKLISNKPVAEGQESYFGVSGIDISEEESAYYGVPVGVYVKEVVAGSGAKKAGIKERDVITAFDGQTVTSMEDIQSIMKYIPAGETVNVTIAEANNRYKEKTVSVTLGQKK